MTQAEQLAAQAAQWQAAGRPDMAVQLYSAALDQDPSKYAVRMQLAECLAYLHQPEVAAEHYLMVAQAYAARGHAQECLAICERIIEIAPHTFVYMSVGPMIRRIGRHARPLCAKAAELHLAAGRQTDGLQILRLGAELDPHNPEVRQQLARIYQGRHMKREAIEALAEAANLLLLAKRYDEYVQVADQILALEPNHVDTLRDLPRVYLELKRPHDAVKALGQLTRANPGDIVGYEILAQAFAVIGRTDKALGVLERLVEELGATGQADKADAILNHARYWRPTDLGFLRSLKRVEIPRPRTLPPVDPPPPAPEGTVVLSIADLMVEESRRAAVPGREDSAVHLVEAEGTLTLDLDELLVDEMEQVMMRGSTPSRPPPPPMPKRAPPPSTGDATITLDGAALAEALLEIESKDGSDDDATTVPPGSSNDDEDMDSTRALDPLDAARLAAIPQPAARRPAAAPKAPPSPPPELTPPAAVDSPATTSSMSALIYDDEDEDEGEPATLLHMKPLTAEDIARAQQAAQAKAAAEAEASVDLDAPTIAPGQLPPVDLEAIARSITSEPAPPPMVDLDAPTVAPPGAQPPPGVDLDAPTVAPPGAQPPPRVDLDAPTMAPPGALPPLAAEPPPMVQAHAHDLDAPTLVPDDAMGGEDGPTLGPSSPDLTFGGGDEAPTMAKLSPLSAADIARALSKGSPPSPPMPEAPPPPVPAPPSPPPLVELDDFDDDEVTPLPGPLPSEPSQPPLLDPRAEAVPNDEEQLTRVHMQALTPEDIARALRKQTTDDGDET